MAKLNVGWSEISITPDKKISLAGQFAERISEYVEKPLMATAMAVECGGDQMVICATDLVGVSYNLKDAVQDALKDNKEGLVPEKVIICAIHTHTGPVYPRGQLQNLTSSDSNVQLLEQFLAPGVKYVPAVDANRPDVCTPQEVFDFLVEKLSKVIIEAWKARKPGKFVNAFDRAAVGMCRRVDYSDGTAQMWGNANTAVFTELEGGNDSGVELMYVFDENDKLTGVVPNLACPAQCVQHRLFVSPDFWGETKVLIREKLGQDIFMLPLCGPAGDQCPVDLVRWVNPETDVHDPNLIRHNPPVRKADPSMFDIAGMKKAGKRVANAILDTYEEIDVKDAQEDIKFEHHVHNMQLPLRRATLSEYNEAIKAIKEYLRDHEGNVDFNDAANLQVKLGIVKRFKLQEKMECLDTDVHIIRMGSVAFATSPFELFLDYGNQIKARQLCEQSFLIQLANGTEGYLPTEKAEKHGHYSAFIASGQIGHEGGDLLVRETLKDINKLFEDDYKVYEYKE
ncbi:MAG: hypothetical protein Q4B67_08400 [Eubacteriales bacterium]|nr:hypothetical protein [Eubacteriales bacterium]